MNYRVAVTSVVLLALMATGAFASFSFDRSETQEWPVPWTEGGVIKVIQEVDKGNVNTPDEGTWKYFYTVVNDGTDGMLSPITIWGFLEDLDGGSILAQGNGQGWTYSGTPIRPDWLVGGGTVIGIGGSGTFWFTSVGPPDRFYDAYAVDTDDESVVYGQTTGPTPEPCTLVLLGLGLSGAGMIRLLKRKRE